MDMHRLLSGLARQSAPCMLATVAEVAGHAYRKRGSAMVLAADGKKLGSISPGCVENDLQERLGGVWESGRPQLIHYNMQPEDDAIWGEALGCGGTIDVLLEPVQDELHELLTEARQRLDAQEAVRFRRRYVDGRMDYSLDLEPAGISVPPEQTVHAGVVFELVSVWRPEPRLILFGAGDDGVPIAALAAKSGFTVTVADWRPGLCRSDRFPDAEFAVGSADEIADKLKLRASDYIVICSHQLERDRRFLELARGAGAHYIGLMGSRRRIALLLGEHEPVPANVYAPIGLFIGAEGPDEIAVSIAAELIAVHRGGAGSNKKEAEQGEAVRYLFGRGKQHADGPSEAVSPAGGWGQPGRTRASCSFR